MRGDKELACLDRFKTELFNGNGNPIPNSNFRNSCFGLLEKDISEFANIIRTVYPNPSSNDFPDFIFDNGYIEHFQITSSKENKKGAMQIKKEREFFIKVENETEKAIEEWGSAEPSYEKIRSKTWTAEYQEHSHDLLIQSFKKNWEHHINSSKNYIGKKDVGIFLVEYPECAFAMVEEMYLGWKVGMTNGDMRDEEEFKEYRLSRDKELLDYIYRFKNEIKYVIFCNFKRYEIIKTENISYIIQLIPWDFYIYPLQTGVIDRLSNISVSIQPKERGNEDE